MSTVIQRNDEVGIDFGERGEGLRNTKFFIKEIPLKK